MKAEQEEKSITYKTLHLLNAFKYHAVIPALTNVIIASYAQKHSLADANFQNDFSEYIKGLIDDKEHVNEEYKAIHQCAYILWIAAIKSKDHEIPRKIAKRIIEKTDMLDFVRKILIFKAGRLTI